MVISKHLLFIFGLILGGTVHANEALHGVKTTREGVLYRIDEAARTPPEQPTESLNGRPTQTRPPRWRPLRRDFISPKECKSRMWLPFYSRIMEWQSGFRGRAP